MLSSVYSIYDIKAQVYQLPFYSPNDAVALRTVYDSFYQHDSIISRHPEDFILYKLGEFDDVRGLLMSTQRLHIANLSSILEHPGLYPEDYAPQEEQVKEDK